MRDHKIPDLSNGKLPFVVSLSPLTGLTLEDQQDPHGQDQVLKAGIPFQEPAKENNKTK